MEQPQPTTDAQREQPRLDADCLGRRDLRWRLGATPRLLLGTILFALPLVLTQEGGPEPQPLAEANPDSGEEPEPPRERKRRLGPVDPIVVERLSFSSDGRLLLAEYNDRPFKPEEEDSLK